MAAASENDCLNDPNFAVICNFLDRYGEMIGLGDISYADLQTWLEDTKHVPSFLVDLHVKLLRRMGKSSVSTERWERYVIKFIHTYSSVDAWEVERFGYKHCKITTKLTILKNLLEKQFDFNSKFKEQINAKPAEDMRFEPLGRDKNGLAYWYLIDKEFNVRVYREDQDDVDAETWEVVCKSRSDLAQLIGTLENEIQSTDVKEESESEAVSLTENSNDDVKKELDDDAESNDRETKMSSTLKKEPDKVDEVDGVTDEKGNGVEDKKNDDIIKCEKRDTDQEVKNEIKEEDSVNMEVGINVKEETTQEEKVKPTIKVEHGVTVKEECREKFIKKEPTKAEETCSLKEQDLPSEVKAEDLSEENAVEIKEEPPPMIKVEDSVDLKESVKPDKESSEEQKEKNVEVIALKDDLVDKEENVPKSENSKKEEKKKEDEKEEISQSLTIVNETKSEISEKETDKEKEEEAELKQKDKEKEAELKQEDKETDKEKKEETDLMQKDKDTLDNEDKLSSVKDDSKPTGNQEKVSHMEEFVDKEKADKELQQEGSSPNVKSQDDITLQESDKDNLEEGEKKASEEEGKYVDEEKNSTKCDKELNSKENDSMEKSAEVNEKTGSNSKDTSECSEEVKQDMSKKTTAVDSNDSAKKSNDVVENLSSENVDSVPAVNDDSSNGNLEKEKENEKNSLSHKNKEEVEESKKGNEIQQVNENKDATDSKSPQVDSVRKTNEEMTGEKTEKDKNDVNAAGKDKLQNNTEDSKEEVDEESKMETEKESEETKVESANNGVESENDSDAVKQSKKAKKPSMKGSRKRGIEYDESAEDSPVEPNSKKAKDGKKIIPRGKRRTPKKVDSSSDSDDIPLSKIGNKSSDSAKKQAGSSPTTPSRKSSRPMKKKKISSDEEESPKKTKSKRRNNTEKSSDSEEEEEEEEEEEDVPTTKKGSKKSKPPLKKTKKQEAVSSDDDVPLKKSKNAKTKSKSEEVVPSDEDDQGRRRSARVRNMKKRKEPTPEPSSFEEDNVDTEFEVGSEEETSDDEFTPTKGRNAQRQEARKRQLEEDEAEEEIPNDTPCCKCQKTHQPEWLLLCDKCDAAFHTACLRPPLMIIPDGDWYCPPCEHKSLVSRLQENLKDLDMNLKKHERIIKRKQRLAYVGISLDNILKEEYKERKENIAPDEEEYESEESQKSFNPKPRKSKYIKRTCRQRNTISYKFEDFDEMIDKAIKQEVEEVKEYKKHNYGRSRGKDMANIYEAEGREYVPSDEEKTDKPPPVVSRKKRSRRLTTLDSDDDDDQGEESEEFHLSDETVSEVPEEEQEDSEEEEISDYSEDGEGWRSGRRSSRYGKATRRSSRKRGRHSIFKDFVVDEEEDSEENRRTARRSARKRVTYRDPSSEEEAETEETEEESFDSEELCSEDSDSKAKKGKRKMEVVKKKKKLETSSGTEQESDESAVKKKSKISKKKLKKKMEESESDSDDESRRRSRRTVKKIDFKSLMMSETESEDGGKSSKKKKKVSSSESVSSDETGTEEEEEVVKKKKNVIRDESSGTDDYEPEEKDDNEEVEKDKDGSVTENKTEGNIAESSAESLVVKSNTEKTDTESDSNTQESAAVVPPNISSMASSEQSSVSRNRGFEDQGAHQTVAQQQVNMYSNFPNVPHGPQNVGFYPPGQQFQNQRLPYSGMEKPVFQPQPGPLKSPPHLTNPPPHSHSHNQRHISSPSQGMSSPPPFPGQNRMTSPPHQMTSPPHNQPPLHSQINPRMSYPPPQMGPRSGDSQRFPNSPPPVPSSQGSQLPFDPRMNQNRMPMDYRGPHPRMLNSSHSYSQYAPSIGNLPPGSQAMNFQNQMRMHGSGPSRMEGPGQMEPANSSPGGPLTSLGQMVVPGYQGPSQQMPRPGVPPNSMNMGMPRHNLPPMQQSPQNPPSRTTGMSPSTQGQQMPSKMQMQNMPPSSGSQAGAFNLAGQGMPPTYPGQAPSFSNSTQSTTPPAADTPKAGSKRGRPKGSKSKKKKDASAENDSTKSPGSSPQVDTPKFSFPVPPSGDVDQRQMHPAAVHESIQRPMMPGNETRSRPPPYIGRNEANPGHPQVGQVPPSDSISRPPDPKAPPIEENKRPLNSDKNIKIPNSDSQKGPVEESNSKPASGDVAQKPTVSEGSNKQGRESEAGSRPPGKEMMQQPPLSAIGQRPPGPEMGHRLLGPDMGPRPLVSPASQMGQHPMPPQFGDMSQRLMHPGMMPPRMMDPRGMPMIPQGHPMRPPMPYPGFPYNRDQYGINGHPASIHSSMQDPGFSNMNPAMMSSSHQNPMMHPSHVSPSIGGGRGFMIDNLLEKNQKSVMSSFSENLEEGTPNSEEGKSESSQLEQEYGPGYQGDQEEEGVSDIADIVKCFKA